MTTVDSLERFLKVEFQTWPQRGAERKNSRAGPVIAISRETGCDGESIARTLANELGLVLYDWEIVEQIAKDAHVSEQVVATLDEKLHSELDEWLDDLVGTTGFSEYQYTQSLRKVLFSIAAHGHAVIVGRCANFLLTPEKRTLGLSLVAPLNVRVQNIMQKLHLSQQDALKHIERTEQEHRRLVKDIGHADIAEATNYHVIINTALVAPEIIVRIVKEMVRAKS
jgi:cytidylate kinase